MHVQFANLRGTGIVSAPVSACDKAAVNRRTAPKPSATGFATMCGVTVDGRPIEYKCTVEGVAPGVKATSLFSPDNRLDLA